MDLTWSASAGATGYVVLRGTTSGGPYARLATTTAPVFSDAVAAANTTYRYVVRATDPTGTSGDSPEASATTAPARPLGVAATTASDVQVDLTWAASAGATSYVVSRGTTPGGPYAQVGTSATASFADTTATASTAHVYVVRATSPSGSSTASSEASATTAPARPTGLGATTVSEARIDLTWTASAGATSYQLLRGATPGGPYALLGTPATPAFSDTTVAANAAYVYVVRAVGAAGISRDSPEAGATSAPARPVSVAATTASDVRIDLTWTASAGAIGYAVSRGTTPGGPYTQVGTPGAASFSDTTAAANTAYVYVVRATSASGASTPSVEVAATSAPAPPTGLAATTASDVRIDLAWTASPGATGHVVLRGAAAGGPYAQIGTAAGATFSDTTAGSNAAHHYVVRSTSAAGASRNSAEASATTAPARPTGVTATTVSDVRIVLGWTASPGATGYVVLRGTTSGGPYAQVGAPAGASFSDATAAPNAAHVYVVRATGAAGTSADSVEAGATTAPAPPTGLAAATASHTRIDLTWTASAGATGHVVLRGAAPGGPYTQLGTPAGAAFSDTTAAPNTTYVYVVRSTSAAGTSRDSAEVAATSAPAPPTGLAAATVSHARIDLTWTPSAGATGHAALRATTPGGPYTQLGTPAGAAFSDATAAPNTTYVYVVRSTSAAGTSGDSIETSATTAPAPPTGLGAVAPVSTRVDLSWTLSAGATGHVVRRGTAPGGPYTPVGTPAGASFADATVVANTAYVYVVRSSSAAGQSGDSAEVAVTTPPDPPVIDRIAPAAAPAGATISLFGRKLTGVTAVTFAGGATATFTFVSDTQLKVVVPTLAQSGVVQATRPQGTGTSTPAFSLRAAPDVSGVSLPGTTISGCVEVQYTVKQAQSARVDIVVEYDPSGGAFAGAGPFPRATQGSSPAGVEPFGVAAVPASPSGTPHRFLWSTVADLPGTTTGGVAVRVRALLQGVAGTAQAPLTGVTVANGVAFTNATTATGASPRAVAVADLNGDGVPDVVTADEAANTASVLLGTGTGTFGAATAHSAGTAPRAVAVGLLNRDGRPDLAVACHGSSEVAVLLGTGGGGYAAATLHAVGAGPRGVSIADVDLDGRADLVVACEGADAVSVLRGTVGGFAAATTIAAGTRPSAVAVGDVNRDGLPDLAVANEGSNDVSLLLATAPGTFGTATSVAVGQGPLGLVLADLDGNTTLDLVTANETQDALSVRLGAGDGTFAVATTVPVGTAPRALAIGEATRDGTLDLLVVHATGAAWLLPGTGGGAFGAAVTIAVGASPAGGALGDLDRDGRLDAVVANAADATVTVATNAQPRPCDPQGFLAALALRCSGEAVLDADVGDVDGDGKLDVVGASGAANEVSLFRGLGGGRFAARTTFAAGTQPRNVRLADVDGDDRLDLVVRNAASNDLWVRLGDGAGSFGVAKTFATGVASGLDVGDLDDDGRPDLATTRSAANVVTILRNTGAGTFAAPVDVATGLAPSDLTLPDLDGDGRLDLVVMSGSAVSIHTSTGGGSFSAPTSYVTNGPLRQLATGDVDRDGALDLFTAGIGGATALRRGVGGGALGPEVPGFFFGSLRGATLADIDDDGRLDLLSTGGSSVLVRSNFGAAVQFEAAIGTERTITADLSGDGRLDVVVITGFDHLAVLLGDGSGLQTALQVAEGQPFTLADVNSDGRLDHISGSPSLETRRGAGNGTFPGNATLGGISPLGWPFAVADMNHDGKLDVVGASGSFVRVARGTGAGGFTGHTSTPFAGRATVVGDFDDDGQLDAVSVQQGTPDKIGLLRGTGAGMLDLPVTSDIGTELRFLATADLDRDGDLDLAVASEGGDAVLVVLNDGAGGFAVGATLGAQKPQHVAVGDLDRDGVPDLVCGNYGGSGATVFLGTGGGTFAAGVLVPTSQRTTQVAITDLDRDGKLDLIVCNESGHTVSVLPGTGTGTFGTAVDYTTHGAPYALCVGDVNGDGRPDVAVGGADDTLIYRAR